MAVPFFCLPCVGVGHPEKTDSPNMSKETKGEGVGKSWVTLELLSLPAWESSLKAQPCSSHDLS